MVELDAVHGRERPTPKRRRTFWWGLLALGLVTAIWGYSNVVIRELELSLPPAAFLLLRYGLVGVFALPWVLRGPRIHAKAWAGGLATGVFLAGTTLTQAIAMRSISVDSVAFITAVYVVLTPLAMALWQHHRPHRIVIAATWASLLGVALLIGHVDVTAAVGTLWALAAAIFATVQIIGTAEVSRVMTTLQLAVIEALGAAITLAIYLAVTGQLTHHLFIGLALHLSGPVIWRLGYLAVLGTLVAGWLQVWGQRRLTATEAALVFNLEPVWTAVFSWLVLSQFLLWLQLLGAGLILASLMALSFTAEDAADLEILDPKPPYREH
ncbi:DMT family transporter [Sulfobacillus harzensis]|uniref:DMT family transporter n=1 Tax=Sulfobacillus harzensis TaxID=2729629 RepID=A0A7Y0L581_9FIRM|nr:DMT family transporter [Sulfobacillus harzensis]NMP22916.1 DMT family transporter [Sulfobacillus harzensis]